jgi:hypothetical protein
MGVDVYIHIFLTSALVGGWVVNFTPRPLYPRGTSPRYSLYRRLGGPQSRSGPSSANTSNKKEIESTICWHYAEAATVQADVTFSRETSPSFISSFPTVSAWRCGFIALITSPLTRRHKEKKNTFDWVQQRNPTPAIFLVCDQFRSGKREYS